MRPPTSRTRTVVSSLPLSSSSIACCRLSAATDSSDSRSALISATSSRSLRHAVMANDGGKGREA